MSPYNIDGIDPDGDSTPGSIRSLSPFLTNSFETSLKDKLLSRIQSKEKFFSFEFFPPKTKSGAINLLARLERMSSGGPLFVDVTWHPAGNPGGDSETSSTMISYAALNYIGLETVLHMTCVGNDSDVNIPKYLEKCKSAGIRNILALRGDIYDENQIKNSKFKYASDLVSYIRTEYEEDDFTIAVAGYPDGHPEAPSYEEDVLALKSKVDAGADFIVTQLFFEASTFKKFVDDCRTVGITVPIIPGILPIQSLDSLRHIVKLSKLQVPTRIQEIVDSIKGNDDAIRNFGIHQAVTVIKELFDSGYAHGFHLYTLNREVASVSIVKRLGLWNPEPQKPLPFKLPAHPKRVREEVRPIFWKQRSKTYVYRTRHWDEFPNGRWGNSSSPAFGELKDYYLFYLASKTNAEDLKSMWGHQLQSEEDVWKVFAAYLTGGKNPSTNVPVTKIPFNDDPLDAETALIADKLAEINLKGVLTINSQPSVNSKPSTDPIVGWGNPGGYVFQKAYLEFFLSRDNLIALLRVLKRYPNVNFHVLNRDKSVDVSNNLKNRPIAVTWGVFPGSEIVQPTVVDPVSFDAWRIEAFGLWTEGWGKLYEEGSVSRNIIDNIAEGYYLVNLVDNEFHGNILWEILDAMFSQRKLIDKLSNDKPSLVEAISWWPASVMEELRNLLVERLGEGFEVHPFLIGWYNEVVSSKFLVNYDPDALAFIVISTPSMFESLFIPHVKENMGSFQADPLDDCMVKTLDKVMKFLPHSGIKIHDFEMYPNRKPKALMQTAGHVSGGVRLYREEDVPENSKKLLTSKKPFPVCLHPVYGGWFALRAVIIFPSIREPNLVRKSPPEIIKEGDKIALLLNLYNDCWQDGRFRDVIPVKQKYSPLLKDYFNTNPSERLEYLKSRIL